jgi:hypothetical protein
MKRTILLLIFCLITVLSFAQSGTYKVQGKVIDSASESVIELVTVQLRKPESKTPEYVQLSDLDGSFTFDKVVKGNYELYISYVGYEPKTITVNADHNINLLKHSKRPL